MLRSVVDVPGHVGTVRRPRAGAGGARAKSLEQSACGGYTGGAC
jgi:hypothetical protein